MPLVPLDRIRSMGLLNRLSSTGLPIAVEFGVSSLKVLHLAPGAEPEDPMVLLGASSLATPDELLTDNTKRMDFQFENLDAAIKASGAKGKRAVCAIPAGQTFCKHMKFHRADGLSTAALVKAAVPQQIGCHPDALLYRHVEVQTAASVQPSGKAEVICLAASRALVERLMGALRNARLEPVGIHPECLATIRAFDMITRRAEDENLVTLYLDLGYGSTKAMIAHGRRLVFTKTIQMGGAQLDQAVAKKQRISLALARARRTSAAQLIPAVATPAPAAAAAPETAAMPTLAAAMARNSREGSLAAAATALDNDASAAAVAEDRRRNGVAPGLTPDLRTQSAARPSETDIDLTVPLEMLTDEIAMCLRYHESMFPDRRVTRSIFVGGEARHRGLCQHIARTLRLPAQVADPLARLARTGSEPASGLDLKQPQPGWAVAYGLCVAPTDL